MPYLTVKVWVDDPHCDDDCTAACENQRLQARIEDAARALRAGDAEAALDILTGDSTDCRAAGLADAYALWKQDRLPGFTRYRAAREAGQ